MFFFYIFFFFNFFFLMNWVRELATLAPSFFASVLPDPPPSPTPRIPRGEGRWSRRVVSRSSPDLKSGASRPSSSIRCTGKNGGKNLLFEMMALGLCSDLCVCRASGDVCSQYTQYPKTLYSEAKFYANVFSDPPPCPTATENSERGG